MKFEDITKQFSQEDIKKNKAMAIISLIGILWLIPLIQKNESAYVKHYMNIGVVATIMYAIYFVISYIPFIGGILSYIVGIVAGIIVLISLIFAITDKAYSLPIVSDIKIIK